MKKIKKQPPERSETPETPVSQLRYVLCYERQSSYFSTDGKKLKTITSKVKRAEIPVTQFVGSAPNPHKKIGKSGFKLFVNQFPNPLSS